MTPRLSTKTGRDSEVSAASSPPITLCRCNPTHSANGSRAQLLIALCPSTLPPLLQVSPPPPEPPSLPYPPQVPPPLPTSVSLGQVHGAALFNGDYYPPHVLFGSLSLAGDFSDGDHSASSSDSAVAAAAVKYGPGSLRAAPDVAAVNEPWASKKAAMIDEGSIMTGEELHPPSGASAAASAVDTVLVPGLPLDPQTWPKVGVRRRPGVSFCPACPFPHPY